MLEANHRQIAIVLTPRLLNPRYCTKADPGTESPVRRSASFALGVTGARALPVVTSQ